jgi:hypothetical protein
MIAWKMQCACDASMPWVTCPLLPERQAEAGPERPKQSAPRSLAGFYAYGLRLAGVRRGRWDGWEPGDAWSGLEQQSGGTKRHPALPNPLNRPTIYVIGKAAPGG